MRSWGGLVSFSNSSLCEITSSTYGTDLGFSGLMRGGWIWDFVVWAIFLLSRAKDSVIFFISGFGQDAFMYLSNTAFGFSAGVLSTL